jgi:minor extracellular serine protease Vpr
MRWRSALCLAALAGLVAAAIVVVPAGGGSHPPAPSRLDAAAAWSGLVGSARVPVGTGQRVLVVLTAFSLADRVQRAGGLAGDSDERRWTSAAFAAQQQFISQLGREGVIVKPEFRFTRTFNGFSAILDPRAIALLERTPGVKGVYPVRVAYPATVPPQLVREAVALAPRPGVRLSGIAGRGVTIALLDTGVDLRLPFLHGHVLDGVDVVGSAASAQAQAKPTDPEQLEAHGTEMAGLLVGEGGPGGLAGVAPAATVLPIRVAAWQTDSRGDYTVYARTDQLLAGLEHAVDPNGDGDAHDAARIALIPLVEPFAAFTDGPLARAVAGALRLDTLVVASAGNDGPGGPAFGSVGGPAGAPDTLAVGALDSRRSGTDVRVVVRAGLSVLFDRLVPLAGAAAPTGTLLLRPAAPARVSTGGPEFFDRGVSSVAGSVAVVPAGADPLVAARAAADAGATAVILYGRSVAAGAIGLDARIDVPVLTLPQATAKQLLSSPGALVAIAAPRTAAGTTRAAPFSSWGLAFDGGIKPDVLAPGVGLVTSEPGARRQFATVSGSSAAAAVAAGAAALLAEARPEASAETLHSLLVGGGRRLPGAPLAAQGAGVLDLGRAAAAELVADPSTLAFGRGTREGWRGDAVVRLRNVSSRRLTVYVRTGQGARPQVPVKVPAGPIAIEPGAAALLRVRTPPVTLVRSEAASGELTVTPVSGTPIRIPWAVVLREPRALLGPLELSKRAFKPSETTPAVVTLRAGRVVRSGQGNTVVPVLRLDVEVWTDKGKRLGLLARLRDVLPGRYALGLTGRGPAGTPLEPGAYRVRVFAWPTGGGPPAVRSIR